jgi:hypothetical protein
MADAIAAISTSDASDQIEIHNTDENAHSDIRDAINDLSAEVSALNEVIGDVDFITVDDIDEICGQTIHNSSEVEF